MGVRYGNLPLSYLNDWAPFKIDALGLVTLLGQEQVSAKLGRLVREGYLDFMPLLGGFVVAGDLFRDRQAGFNIYNITSGITTPEMSGWFTRWLKAQEFDKQKIDVEWIVEDRKRSYSKLNWIAFMIGFVFQAGFLALTILIGDWYGIANSVSMTASVLVRVYVLKANRDAIDLAVENATRKAIEIEKADPTEDPRRVVTILCVLDDATAIIMRTPEHLIKSCFVVTPKPPHPSRYWLARAAGWIFFLIHIISIGQSVLISQMITIALLVVPTVAMVALPARWRHYLGCDEQHIGKRLTGLKKDTKAKKPPEGTRRVHLYAMCQFLRKEEESMLHWSTMPHSSNKKWWEEYQREKQDYARLHPEDVRDDPDSLPHNQSTTSLVQPVFSNQPGNTQLVPPPYAAIAMPTNNIANPAKSKGDVQPKG